MGKIDVLMVEPGKEPRVVGIEDSLESAEKVLGGAVQVGCFLPQKVLLISRQCQEGLAPNRCMPDGKGVVRGAFLLCGVPEEGCMFDSLSAERLKEFEGVFREPGEFVTVGDEAYADPDDEADAVYRLWDSMKDGESILLTKWGGKRRDG